MTKNLFGNLSNSDDLNEKYQKAGEENIRMDTAKKFDEEVESFKGGKHDIVWASKFDSFSKNNQQVIKDAKINRYCQKLELYETLLKEAQQLIEEDNKRRQEYALQKARELQKQKEEEARKRHEYVLDVEKRIVSLRQNVKTEKAWVDAVLKVNSEFSVLTDQEKKEIPQGANNLKGLVSESSHVSTVLMCDKDIHELEKAKRDNNFVKKYDELKGVVDNISYNVYFPKETLNLFAKLGKDYYEIKNKSLVDNLLYLIDFAKKKNDSNSLKAPSILSLVIGSFTKKEADLYLEIRPQVEKKHDELKVVIPSLDSDMKLVKERYDEYVISEAKSKVRAEAENIKSLMDKEQKKTLSYTGSEKTQTEKSYNEAVLAFNTVIKNLTQKDLDVFSKYFDSYKRLVDGIEKEHKRLQDEANAIDKYIADKIDGVKKKYPLPNYRTEQAVEINDILDDLRKKLLNSLYYSKGVFSYRISPTSLIDDAERQISKVKTDKQLKAEEIERARIEEENRRIAATKAQNRQIDEIFIMAKKGDPEAMYQLAELYFNGEGVSESPKEAVKWYEKAAHKGHPKAIEKLGDCYYNGYGVKQSFKEAAKWYKKL